MIGIKTLLSLLVLVTGAWAPTVTAQAVDTLNGPPSAPFFNRTDAFLAAGFVAGAFGLVFADQHLAHAPGRELCRLACAAGKDLSRGSVPRRFFW